MPAPTYRLIQGDNREVLPTLDAESMDSMVTDPPAGVAFMASRNSGWDDFRGKGDQGPRANFISAMTETFAECLRILKPGAHGLVWALPRTSHWTATALEDAGFEVRDVVTHLFGSGFPKSQNIRKAVAKVSPEEAETWQGWGTALKPSNEHWILVRKPLSEKTIAANVMAHGTGGLNIDASRVKGGPGFEEEVRANIEAFGKLHNSPSRGWKNSSEFNPDVEGALKGRWPPNTLFSHTQFVVYRLADDLPEQVSQAILAYYGIVETLSAVRSVDLGHTLHPCTANVLQYDVCGSFPQSHPQEGVGPDTLPAVQQYFRGDSCLGTFWASEVLQPCLPRQGQHFRQAPGYSTYSSVSGEDVAGSPWGSDHGKVFPMEGREDDRFSGLHPRRSQNLPPIGADVGGSYVGEGEKQISVGAPFGAGGVLGSPPSSFGDSSPPQWCQIRQQAGESDGGRPQISLSEASFDRDRGLPTTCRKHSLEVPLGAIPHGWRPWFEPSSLRGCKRVGTVKAPAPVINRFEDGMKPFGEGAGHPYTQVQTGDANGEEDVAVYQCEEGCPVAAVDTQSGISKSTVDLNLSTEPTTSSWLPGLPMTRVSRGDTGGASRFFPNFQEPFLYTGKAPPAEKLLPDGSKTTHPTPKSLALMAWLIRLVTPPGGVVLDPFAGTGSTLVAALQEGFSAVGIEREASYAEEARSRLAPVEQETRTVSTAKEGYAALFDVE